MNKENNKKNIVGAWWQMGLSLFLRLSSWIVFPILVAVVVGKFLDKVFGTMPWLLLVSILMTFFFSMFKIVRIGLREMEKDNKKSNC